MRSSKIRHGARESDFVCLYTSSGGGGAIYIIAKENCLIVSEEMRDFIGASVIKANFVFLVLLLCI
jgi:hypothetical protein